MYRRKAGVFLFAVSGGVITLPFWMTACRMSDKNIHLSSFTPTEQETLASMADTIIPAGAAGQPGALSVGVDKFLQKLMDDCYEQPEKDEVKKQLAAMDAAAKTAYGHSFAAAGRQERQAILMTFGSSPDKNEKDFFGLMKSETIRGFNTSQQVMEGYLKYKIAPGHYYGCIPLKA